MLIGTFRNGRLLESGIRPTRTFQQAAIKWLDDNRHKKCLERYVDAFNRLMPNIGQPRLDLIHNDTLADDRQTRRADGVSASTIRKQLSCLRRLLKLAARVWRHDNGVSWLDAPPLIEMQQGPAKKPYPLSWEEQDRLFQTKNSQERVVVLNSIARHVVDEQRSKHPEFVFTYRASRPGAFSTPGGSMRGPAPGWPTSGCMTFVIIPSSGLFRVNFTGLALFFCCH